MSDTNLEKLLNNFKKMSKEQQDRVIKKMSKESEEAAKYLRTFQKMKQNKYDLMKNLDNIEDLIS